MLVNSLLKEVSGSHVPQKRGAPREKIISPSIFEARCSGLEQIVVAVESYNIAVLT